jgi:hypothetical protein
MTPEDAWREEAYDNMVREVLESHKDEIIGEFVLERLAAYYNSNPDLADSAKAAIEQAEKLLPVSPEACVIFSRIAIEITLRDVMLKPVAFGMLHDDETAPLIAELVTGNVQFTKLLFKVLVGYGIDLKTIKRSGSPKSIWLEMEEIKKCRDQLIHHGGATSAEMSVIAHPRQNSP